MSNYYQHIPIVGARSIRVLELQPANDLIAPIHCKLKTVSLNDFPQWHANYTALSYTWDGQNPSRQVNCDGGSLLITPNCEEAIRQLRSAKETQVLWIDSICIDQTPEAVKERNIQVALMGEIYKSAARVVVWLGSGNERVERALQQIMNIAMITRSAPRDLANRKMIQEKLRTYTRNLSDSIDSASADPIGPLFECSWFYRMWTIQEATLSGIERTFLRCGSSEIPWPVLVIAIDALKTGQYRWGRWEEAMHLQKQLVTYLMVRRFSFAKAILDDNPGNVKNDPLMFSILINTRKKMASNEKDKIIALYGLFAELDIPFPKPDYTMSVEDIYRQATAAAIDYDKNLYILYHVPSDKRRRTLASWVPDWAEPGFEPKDPRYGILRDRFAASGPGEPIWSFSDSKKSLVLRGRVVDTVIFKAEPLPDSAPILKMLQPGQSPNNTQGLYLHHNHVVAKLLRSWVEISKWTDYPTGETSREALQRTLVQDNPYDVAKLSENNIFGNWYDNMSAADIRLVAKEAQRMSLQEASHSLDEAPHQQKADYLDMQSDFTLFGCNRFHQFATLACAQKCFFYTEKNYFGTSPDPLPESMQAGDMIAVVSGLEMPLLLRPFNGGYKLITHVYVHGMMYGEHWPGEQDQLDDIVLV